LTGFAFLADGGEIRALNRPKRCEDACLGASGNLAGRFENVHPHHADNPAPHFHFPGARAAVETKRPFMLPRKPIQEKVPADRLGQLLK
jgi:hypothetical protein